MSIVDAIERAAALDPTRSFCISAPAGSGKTELLIQRYLSLLARVQRPEQILAITFTRKAAAEMRERVVEALASARDERPCDGDHQQRTRALALAALAMDRERNWQLLGNSARLNIRTIDGFCAALTRQMPVLSAFGAQAAAVDDPAPLYTEAVAELFTLVDSDHPVAADLRALMLHFDNNWEKLAELLQGLLGRRDQWRTYVGVHHSPEASEQQLRHTLQGAIHDTLERLRQQLGPYLGELYELQCFGAEQLGQPEPAGPPGATAQDLPTWRQLRRLLLTADGKKWRSRIDKTIGFPPGKGRPAEMKQRLQAVLDELSGDDALRRDLTEVDVLPALEADAASWRLVLHLSHVLPILAAQLLLVFQRHGQVDHNQVALSALQALGEDEAPTDLALRLDYRIEHIMVDEFQDTASNQYQLVQRLTRGWGEHNAANPGAPRTFLIVGDGMQSIYGFRNANVGLFLKARQSGFNGVVPDYLKLRSNFRSEAGVVDWVNSTFSEVFPAQDDFARGEVKFSPATAVKSASPAPAVDLTVFHGEGAREAEVAHVCNGVAAALAEDQGSIAVLARSRPQLQGIVAGLRERGIAFAAQDMDRLQHSPVVQDLLTLTRALANRGDRVAWMALLRAPWCGLRLADLLALARARSRREEGGGEEGGNEPPGRYLDPLAQAQDETVRAMLSADGRRRLDHLAAALAWAEARRDRLALRAWLEQVWLRLGGPATVVRQEALADAERFFSLLERAELEGRGLDIPWLQAQLERLYADAGGADSRVQVMTLHRAKGLEFDWVFIPALARGAASDRRPLLLWDEVSGADGDTGILLAADDHSKTGEPGLYNYLARQRQRKQALENTRLLYVGATRAVRRLVLSATLLWDERREAPGAPGAHTLLACIWPAVEQQARMVNAEAEVEVETGPSESTAPQAAAPDAPPLLRLAAWPEVTGASATAVVEQGIGGTLPEPATNRLDRHVGSAVHRMLEMLVEAGTLPEATDDSLHETCRWTLACLGLQGDDLEYGLRRVTDSLAATLGDRSAGRWLLRADHRDSACELALTRIDGAGNRTHLVVDRTFIDADTGERWIIDYKTSQPGEEVPLDIFLAEEAARYHGQLAGYREALAALGPEPVRCALYFTALGRLHPL